MGVPGLWDILRPAATRHSLSFLAKEAVLANKNNLRALTIGIDASIWIFHAQVPTSGENPFLRTIFFKITSLLQQPVLPVFVFDGPDKPSFKRNQKIGGAFGVSDSRSRLFKELLDECGLEWWNAPGEAEAELAVMNRQGKIDAVLSDDVDTLLFGATCLIRNNSPTLTGNAGKTDGKQYAVYRLKSIHEMMTSKEGGTSLVSEEDCRMAMVFIALLAGGDYVPEGLEQFGPTIAHALAHAGFGDILKLYETDREAFNAAVDTTHARIIEELKSNSTGHLGQRFVARAAKLAEVDPSHVFPKVALDAYLTPSTSPLADLKKGWPGFGQGEKSIRRGKARNEGRGDMEGLARACEKYFEWGTKDLVVKKFAGESVGVYGTELMNHARETMRRQARRTGRVTRSPIDPPATAQSQTASDSRIDSFFPEVRPGAKSPKRGSSTVTPDHIIRIHNTREDPSDPTMMEYRISFEHMPYSHRTRGAMSGHRVDPKDLDLAMRKELGLVDKDSATSTVAELKQEQRVWIADYLVQAAWPDLVDAYEAELRRKEELKRKKEAKMAKVPCSALVKGKKSLGPSVDGMNPRAFDAFFTQRPISNRTTQTSRQSSTSSPIPESESDIEVVEPVEDDTARREARRTRHHPTSSLSSIASDYLSPPPTSIPISKTTRVRRVTRASSAAKTASQNGRVSSKSARAPSKETVEVINLCSSDDETPKASRVSKVLAPTTMNTEGSPSLHRAPRSPKKKSRAATPPLSQLASSQSRQTRLELPILGPSSQRAKVSTPKSVKRSPKKQQAAEAYYMVLSETDDEIEIDITGTRTRATV